MLSDVLRQRRDRLTSKIEGPILIWSGRSSSRNFAANTYPFRASSHFLYFAGLSLEDAAIALKNGQVTLFMHEPTPAGALWHGPSPTLEDVAAEIGADAVYPRSHFSTWVQNKLAIDSVATIAVPDPETRAEQSQLLGRSIAAEGRDLALIQAIVALRSQHDEAALTEMRRAIAVTVEAHQAGMAATSKSSIEAGIRSAMEGVIMSHNMTCAYNSIVTVHGEVLHNNHYHHAVQPTDLVLADVGAETETGWASDVTRTWSASGKFSATQRAVYDVVLEAHDRAIAAVCPGAEYQEIHLLGCHAIAEGLVDLGILRGNPADLVDRDAHALFFPHGMGHLLGLDVHDMEDVGDLAGYEAGRTRSDRFGLGYLRLNRPLQPGMVVTIEPGFYQVPALLNDRQRREKYNDVVNWDRLAEFSDVRGIRIEDDVLVTAEGSEVLTAALPNDADSIEQMVS